MQVIRGNKRELTKALEQMPEYAADDLKEVLFDEITPARVYVELPKVAYATIENPNKGEWVFIQAGQLLRAKKNEGEYYTLERYDTKVSTDATGAATSRGKWVTLAVIDEPTYN